MKKLVFLLFVGSLFVVLICLGIVLVRAQDKLVLPEVKKPPIQAIPEQLPPTQAIPLQLPPIRAIPGQWDAKPQLPGLQLPPTEPDVIEPTWEDFTGGLNESHFPDMIEDRDASKLENFVWSKTKRLEPRPGFDFYDSSEFDAGEKIWGLYPYYTSSGDKILLAGVNDTLWADTNATGTFVVVKGGLQSNSKYYDFETFKNKAIVVHEGDFPFWYDGNTTQNLGLVDSLWSAQSYYAGYCTSVVVLKNKYYDDNALVGYVIRLSVTAAYNVWAFIIKNEDNKLWVLHPYIDASGDVQIYSWFKTVILDDSLSPTSVGTDSCWLTIKYDGLDIGNCCLLRLIKNLSTNQEAVVFKSFGGDSIIVHKSNDFDISVADQFAIVTKEFWRSSLVEIYKNRIFLADTNLIVFSRQNKLNDFPPTGHHFVVNTEDGDNITALATFYDDQLGYKDRSRDCLVIFKNNSIFKLVWNSVTDYYLVQVSDNIGCVAPQSIVNIEGKYLLFLHSTGVYAFDGRTIKLISQKIDKTIQDIERNPYHNLSAAGYENRHYYLSYPGWNPADTTEESWPDFEYIQEVQVCYRGTNDSSASECQMRIGLVMDGDSYWHSTRDTLDIEPDTLAYEMNSWTSNPAEGRVWLPQDIEELTVRLANTEVYHPSVIELTQAEMYVYWRDDTYHVTKVKHAQDTCNAGQKGLCPCDSIGPCDDAGWVLYGVFNADSVWSASASVSNCRCCAIRLDSALTFGTYIQTLEPFWVHDCLFADSTNYLGQNIDGVVVRTYQQYLSYVIGSGCASKESLSVGGAVNIGWLIDDVWYPYSTDDTVVWVFAGQSPGCVGATWDTTDHAWTTNPATDLPWTGAELNNAEWRVRSKLIEGSGDMRISQLYVKVIWGIGSTDTTILLPFGDGTKDEWSVVGATEASDAINDYPNHDTNTTYIHPRNLLGPWQDIDTWTAYVESGPGIDTAWADTLNAKTMAWNIDFGGWSKIVGANAGLYSQQKAISDTVKLFFADPGNRSLIYQFGKVTTDTGEAIDLVFKSKAFDFGSIAHKKRVTRFFVNYYLLTGDFSTYFYTDFGDTLRYADTVTTDGGYRYIRIPLNVDCRARNFSYEITSSSLLELGKIRLRLKKEED